MQEPSFDRTGLAGLRRGPGRYSFQLPDLPGGLRPLHTTRTPPTTNQWPMTGTGQCGLWQFGAVQPWWPAPACGPAQVAPAKATVAVAALLRAAGCEPKRPPCQGTVITILPRAWPVALTS